MAKSISRSQDWSDDDIDAVAGDDPLTAFLLGGQRYAERSQPAQRRKAVGTVQALGELENRSAHNETLCATGDATTDDRTFINRARQDGFPRGNNSDPTVDREEVPDEGEWRRIQAAKALARDTVSRSYVPGTKEWHDRKERELGWYREGLAPWYTGPFGPEQQSPEEAANGRAETDRAAAARSHRRRS